MDKVTNEQPDAAFLSRRIKARETINSLDEKATKISPQRNNFFKSVYDIAGDDAAKVPWADLEPKSHLIQWLKGKSGINLTALDIACGLGDHAELLSGHGYSTNAFDVSETAIDWAKRRFPKSDVDYRPADLFDLPSQWTGAFDLVWECYTLQALHPDLFEKSAKAIADLVKKGGTLLVYTRHGEKVSLEAGPPWPLSMEQSDIFAKFGFEMQSKEVFQIDRPDKTIPHVFTEWRKV